MTKLFTFAAGTVFNFGSLKVVLTEDTEMEVHGLETNQQLAEALFGADRAMLDENLSRLDETVVETQEHADGFSGGTVKETVTYAVTYGNLGHPERREVSRVPYEESDPNAPAEVTKPGDTAGNQPESDASEGELGKV